MKAEEKTNISKNAVERMHREFNLEKQMGEFLGFYG